MNFYYINIVKQKEEANQKKKKRYEQPKKKNFKSPKTHVVK